MTRDVSLGSKIWPSYLTYSETLQRKPHPPYRRCSPFFSYVPMDSPVSPFDFVFDDWKRVSVQKGRRTNIGYGVSRLTSVPVGGSSLRRVRWNDNPHRDTNSWTVTLYSSLYTFKIRKEEGIPDFTFVLSSLVENCKPFLVECYVLVRILCHLIVLYLHPGTC